eukprot:6390730-Amphidinium_carterae.1
MRCIHTVAHRKPALDTCTLGQTFYQQLLDTCVSEALLIAPRWPGNRPQLQQSAAVQPRRSRVAAFIAEFAALIQVISAEQPSLDSKGLLRYEFHGIAAGARFLTRDSMSAPYADGSCLTHMF